jgi:ketosteroid isomerase-like protein
MKRIIMALAALVCTPATAQAVHSQITPPHSAEMRAFKAAIRKLYDRKERDFAEGRDDHILNRFYSDDAVSFGEGEGISVGRADFRKVYDEVTRQSTVKVRSVYTYVAGNAGWDWANFFVTPRDPKDKPFSFAIVFLWAREHGRWICKGDAYAKGAFPEPGAEPGR